MKYWRPSVDELNVNLSNELWAVIEERVFDAIPIQPLENFDDYVLRKTHNSKVSEDSIKSKLHNKFIKYRLGEHEVDLISMLISYTGKRQIAIVGNRGVGKTSFIKYVEDIIKKSRNNRASVFINFDCRGINETNFKASLVRMMIDNFESIKGHFKNQKVIEEAISKADINDEQSIVFCLSFICKNLAPIDSEKIVLVFDNLDHLEYKNIKKIMGLVKQLNVSTNIPVVSCIRPNCVQRIAIKGDARALFGFRIKLSPPDIDKWFKEFGNRVVKSFVKHLNDSQTIPIAYGQTITQKELSRFFLKVRSFLLGRIEDDNIFRLLEKISADDTRHLKLLIERLLQHHNFPARQLFLRKKIEVKLHHPYQYLLKGNSGLYRENKLIPNLYFHSCERGQSYTLLYRIICLISGNGCNTDRIIRAMSLLNYNEKYVKDALNFLSTTLIIRGTTAVTITESIQPESYYLTHSGKYYLSYFISTPDYVTNVIMDVELNHSAYSQRFEKLTNSYEIEPKLSEVIDSLMEGYHKIFDCEKNEIMSLITLEKGEVLYSLANSFYSHELLSHQILTSLEKLEKRIPDKYSDLNTKISVFLKENIEKSNKFKETRLKELLNKFTKSNNYNTLEKVYEIESVKVRLYLDNALDSTNIMVGVDINHHDLLFDLVIVTLISTDSNNNIYYASKSFSQEFVNKDFIEDKVNRITFPKLESDLAETMEKNNIAVKVMNILPLNESLINSNIALITTVICDKKLEIFFSIVGVGETYERKIGSISDIDELIREVSKTVEDINAISAEGRLTEEILDIACTKVTKCLLTNEGEEIIAFHLENVDKAVVCISDDLLSIPWEWIRPSPNRSNETSSIGEAWKVYRTQTNNSDYVEIDFNKLNFPLDLSKYISIGGDNLKSSIIAKIEGVRTLYSYLKNFNISHLIGHYEKGQNVLKIGKTNQRVLNEDQCFSIDSWAVEATAYNAENSLVIISSCGISLVNYENSIIAKMAVRNGSEIWAPLINISVDTAITIDERIHDSELPHSTQEDVWEHVMKYGLLNRMYSRFISLHST